MSPELENDKKSVGKVILTIILVLGVLLLCAYHFLYVQRTNETIKELQNENHHLGTRLSRSEDMCSQYQADYTRVKLQYDLLCEETEANDFKVNFFDKFIVCVSDTGGKYHRPDCKHVQRNPDSSYFMLLQDAQWQGYTACLDCY